MTEPLHVHFEDLGVGEVVPLGACMVDAAALDVFVERFLPGWDASYGAPDAMVYALPCGAGSSPTRPRAGPSPRCWRSTGCAICAIRRPAN